MSTDRLKQLLDFYKNAPKDSFLIFALAKEYESLQNISEALAYYLKLEELDPNYIGLYYHLGKLYEVLEENIKAQKTYKTGIVISQEAGDYHAVSELNNALQNLEIQMGN